MFGYLEDHVYSLASTGLMPNVSETFSSRQAANERMYSICSRRGLRISEVYDDNHDKTYICDNGVRFYVQRAW